MNLYHFPNAELQAKFNQLSDKMTIAKVDPKQAKPNSFSRKEFQTWNQPRTFWYVDQCNDVEPFFKGRQTVLFNAMFQHGDAFHFCQENFNTFESVTGSSLDTMTTQEYFDALKSYCIENGLIGFTYRVQNRLIFTTWLPLVAKLVNVDQQ